MTELAPFDRPLFKGATENHMPALHEPHPLEWYLDVPRQLAGIERIKSQLDEGLEWWKAELVHTVLTRFGDTREGSQLYTELEDKLGLKYVTLNSYYRAVANFPDPATRIPKVGPSIHADLGKLEPPQRDEIAQKARDHEWTRAEIREEKKRVEGVEVKPTIHKKELEDLCRRLVHNARPGSFGWYEVPEVPLEELTLLLDAPPLPDHVIPEPAQGVLDT